MMYLKILEKQEQLNPNLVQGRKAEWSEQKLMKLSLERQCEESINCRGVSLKE